MERLIEAKNNIMGAERGLLTIKLELYHSFESCKDSFLPTDMTYFTYLTYLPDIHTWPNIMF